MGVKTSHTKKVTAPVHAASNIAQLVGGNPCEADACVQLQRDNQVHDTKAAPPASPGARNTHAELADGGWAHGAAAEQQHLHLRRRPVLALCRLVVVVT